ncbi:hypothetical protein JYK22_25525, partial [Nonomuraea sp. RK-328]|nr:hypothetical protein [Nonomuraea sp. RK-328]
VGLTALELATLKLTALELATLKLTALELATLKLTALELEEGEQKVPLRGENPAERGERGAVQGQPVERGRAVPAEVHALPGSPADR